MKLDRKLRMGMVGGGPGAFFGEVHRRAARLDGGIELTAGAFSSQPARSRQMGRELGLDAQRVYGSYGEMIEKERHRSTGDRLDFISIVTPNDSHYPVACASLRAGFHVLCEKPMTMNVAQAREVQRLVKKTGLVFGLMHNYSAYPMVKLARDLVKKGELGKIRKVIVQYPQDWLIPALRRKGRGKAIWRVNPTVCGPSGVMGDIGTHAVQLAEHITGLRIEAICADLTTFLEGCHVEDDGNCLLRFDNGARGILHASRVCIGHENDLAIWVYGDKKSLEWHQENPHYLRVKEAEGPVQVWRAGNDYVARTSPGAARVTRLPGGCPEGYFEACANIYRNFGDTLRAVAARRKPTELERDFPSVEEGLRGMLFIEAVLASAKSSKKWTRLSR